MLPTTLLLLISLLSFPAASAYESAERAVRVQVRRADGDNSVTFGGGSGDNTDTVWYNVNANNTVKNPIIRPIFAGQVGSDLTCTFQGTLDPRRVNDIAFVFTSTRGRHYLHPCEAQFGLRIVCDNPAPACEGPYLNHDPTTPPSTETSTSSISASATASSSASSSPSTSDSTTSSSPATASASTRSAQSTDRQATSATPSPSRASAAPRTSAAPTPAPSVAPRLLFGRRVRI